MANSQFAVAIAIFTHSRIHAFTHARSLGTRPTAAAGSLVGGIPPLSHIVTVTVFQRYRTGDSLTSPDRATQPACQACPSGNKTNAASHCLPLAPRSCGPRVKLLMHNLTPTALLGRVSSNLANVKCGGRGDQGI